MAWTAPKTDWPTAQLVTAANMNTYLRDNLKSVGNHLAFTTWAPALSITSGTTAPNLGASPTRSGSYMLLGTTVSGLVHGSCHIRFGTSGYAAGTGVYTVSLPIAMSSSDTARQQTVGGGALYDASGADTYTVIAVQHSSAVLKLKWESTGSTERWVTGAAPFAFGSSDQIHLHLCYGIS